MQPLSWPLGALCEEGPFPGQGSPQNFLPLEPGPGPGSQQPIPSARGAMDVKAAAQHPRSPPSMDLVGLC